MVSMTPSKHLTRGSVWHRWDPHIHAPGTALNDQYSGENKWESYFEALETASPVIQAIGVTDYYLLDTYETVIAAKADGRLPNVGFIFPNVELRLATGTDRAKAINFHLLINPEADDHVAQIKRFLARLTFRYQKEELACTEDDLRALGYAHDESCKSDKQALGVGVNQFKVEFDSFVERWEASEWIQQNALIAVATGQGDGTAGLQKDASLSALRQKIETAAHIMFASSPQARAYWLGKSEKAGSKEIIENYGALKPCLHGSDAHEQGRVGAPDHGRYSWIKGDLDFEALRQICLEPEDRVIVATSPPTGPVPSNVIASIEVSNAPWFTSESVPLNPGLVGIIGARGSGKTALADMIAAGAFSLSSHVNARSFVQRAQEYIEDEVAHVEWGDGEVSENELKNVEIEDFLDNPRVQYLSQHFVETLCSASGATDALVAEIERVIFSAHSAETRQGSVTFHDLLDTRAALGRQQRDAYERSIAEATEEMAGEWDKIDKLAQWEARSKQLKQEIKSDLKSKSRLITEGEQEKAEAFEKVSNAVEYLRQVIAGLDRQKSTLKLLQADVREYRETIAPSAVRRLSRERRDAAFSDAEWERFLTDFVGDVDALLTTKLKKVESKIQRLTGTAPEQERDELGEVIPSGTSLLSDGTKLKKNSLRVLEAEAQRLELLIGADRRKQRQFGMLTEKIAKTKAQLKSVKNDIKDAKGAKTRIDELVKKRNSDYSEVFNGILAEESALRSLYEPLDAQLQSAEGAVARLAISIKRHVDVDAWTVAGEKLLDLRRGDSLRGRGALLSAANKHLRAAWETGDGAIVSKAMAKFRNEYREEIVNSAPYDKKTQFGEYRIWARRITDWIYSTDHISVTYSLTFDDVEIERLSPGTRGIVLLLLYLAIDRDDDRPLMIDQPEENLDPKSIFEELVARFRKEKLRRQIIIVTHNANLIVNADADQVIVASCGPHDQGALPEISYESGSLEDAHIRAKVCDILEGGEQAFRERAKRLRIKFS